MDEERESFESWANSEGMSVYQHHSGLYVDSDTRLAWRAWTESRLSEGCEPNQIED